MKQVLTITDLATLNYLVNREIQNHERMAREEYTDEDIFKKIILPLNNKKVQDTLKSDLFYQDLLHLKNALNNINVEVETADIKVK